jgi:hypothetical protein
MIRSLFAGYTCGTIGGGEFGDPQPGPVGEFGQWRGRALTTFRIWPTVAAARRSPCMYRQGKMADAPYQCIRAHMALASH